MPPPPRPSPSPSPSSHAGRVATRRLAFGGVGALLLLLSWTSLNQRRSQVATVPLQRSQTATREADETTAAIRDRTDEGEGDAGARGVRGRIQVGAPGGGGTVALHVKMHKNGTTALLDDGTRGGAGGGAAASSCRRACPHYDNRITIQSKQRAGMKDRTYIMYAWANLGMFLCARVRVPPPSGWLVAKHNWNDTRVDERVSFQNDLLRFVDADDPGEVVLGDLVDVREPEGGWGLEMTSSTRRDVKSVKRDFLRAYDHTLRQQQGGGGTDHRPFHWTVGGSHNNFKGKIHDVMDELREQANVTTVGGAAGTSVVATEQLPKWTKWRDDRGCVYAAREEARGVTATAERVLRALRERFFGVVDGASSGPFVYGYLHVRRGDAVRSCDTELSAMEKYVNCTFASLCREEEGRHCRTGVPLLIGSDERNETYRRGLLSLVDDHPHLHAVDLDKEVMEEIEREIARGDAPRYKRNNFSVFLVGKMILQGAAFYVQQNRQYCPRCESHNVVIDDDARRRWWSSWLPMNIRERREDSDQAYDNLANRSNS